MKISAMVLVGENEPYLSYCIESIKDIVDEIVFIVKEMPCGCHPDPLLRPESNWNVMVQEDYYETDFASWRNKALAECSGEYILMLDADEILAKPDGSPCSRELLEEIIKNNKDAYHIFTFHFMYDYRTIDGRNDGIHHSHCRLFKNDNVRFEGKIHEYLTKEQTYQNDENSFSKAWTTPESYAYVNNPCIWHYGGCKGMEDIRQKYARTRDIEGNPFRSEHLKYKDNDEYCKNHPIFQKSRPLIQYYGSLPRVMKLW